MTGTEELVEYPEMDVEFGARCLVVGDRETRDVSPVAYILREEETSPWGESVGNSNAYQALKRERIKERDGIKSEVEALNNRSFTLSVKRRIRHGSNPRRAKNHLNNTKNN